MTIPCKDCLVYAACRSREKIRCSLLFEWMHTDDNEHVEIEKFFPGWTSITNETNTMEYLKPRRRQLVYPVKIV